MAAGAASAGSFHKVNWTFYGGNAAVGGTVYYGGNDGMVYLTHVELNQGTYGGWGHVCDYKGKTKIVLPSNYTYTDYSSYHSGCSWLVGYVSLSHVSANYPDDSTIKGYFKSTSTSNSYKFVRSHTW